MPVLDRFSDFIKSADKPAQKSTEDVLKDYLSTGGLLKVDRSNPRKPRILYPDRRRLTAQLDDLQKRRKNLEAKISHWEEAQRRKAETLSKKVSLVLDPLYWEHILRSGIDAGYREAVRVVDPPVKMMREAKWRKPMEMFVRSADYRERLKEARTSLLGESRGTMREDAEKSDGFEEEVIGNRLEKLRKELENYVKKESVLAGLLEFVE